MIDARGRALHRLVKIQIELEEDRFSDPLSEAIENFDNYLNCLNNTAGCIYDRFGNILMES